MNRTHLYIALIAGLLAIATTAHAGGPEIKRIAGHDFPPEGALVKPETVPLPDVLSFPFKVQQGQLVVEAAVNGVRGNFLVDTGAQSLVLNTAHFTAEQLPTVAMDHGAPSGVGGAMSGVRAARDLTLNWGDMRLDDLRAIAIDLSHFEERLGVPVVGLIAFSILEGFELHFDYAAGILTLYRLGSDDKPVNPGQRGAPAAVVPFELVGHIPVFPVAIGGEVLRLGVDSGAAEAMLFEKWEEAMADEYQFIRVAEMRGADKAVRASNEVRFDTMTVNNIDYADVIFRFSDIVLAGGGTPDMDGLLGYEFLRARPTSINFRTRQISIW